MDTNVEKSEIAKREEQILEFWKKNNIFKKSLEKSSTSGEFVFYEGPPTANAKPGIHHLEARAFKDAIPRYKTMRGFRVRRKGGWDTHGLPVELQVEKKLGLNSKKGIEEYGVAKFNQECKINVWEQIDNWTKFTERIGYWVDQENPYVTYHNSYIESVWNVLKKVNEQDLLYKDYKVVPWCPRCGTTLSSHELAQGYEIVKDLSVYVKFKIKSSSEAEDSPEHIPATYIIAWTTTPWTLPGNVALAVGENIDYLKIKKENLFLIIAKNRISVIEGEYEVVEELKGSNLIGLEYEPLYPFLANTIFETEKHKLERAFKVYGADFVTTEDGTGIVHTAVMYGQDDFVLGTEIGLPKHHLVGLDGKFLIGTGFLEGRFVRDEQVAVDIIKDLAHRGLLFKKEKYEHSYPHCWRCKTALIYYARDSWYIKMSDPVIREKMIKENQEINWEPMYTRDGRFGEWLKDIKDWAISRERYWGTPLPVWTCESCKKVEVVGSLQELKEKTKKSSNRYFVMRHGEAENNAANIYSSNQKINHLTPNGRNKVLETAQSLKQEKISKIYCSPFLRTRETAEIVADQIGFPKDKIIYDERIRELEFGDFSEHPVSEYWDFMNGKTWEFDTKVPGGESFQDGKKRIGEFLYEIDQQNKNESVLIISHGLTVEIVPALIEGADKKRSLEIFNYLVENKPASLHREHKFIPLPHNENYELDLHRPYIDEIKLVCAHSINGGQACGGNLIRTKEVMDVWLDSGAMPFAQDHYPFDFAKGKPFENKELLYPADFICEAIDQTRGWFYTLHAVGTLMGRGKAYKNVICLGHLLDDKGKKMSKSLGNVVDPWLMIEKYGVDALRLWMYSVNQPGESKNFDEKTVLELHRQVFGLLYNVLAFYELYRDKDLEHDMSGTVLGTNVLDQWIIAKLNELVKIFTENLDGYKLLEPTRAIRDFIGDLSTWYLRRSRERIKEGDKSTKQTLYHVLKTLAKLIAPLAPLSAEDIWLKLKNNGDEESVHLVAWPEAGEINLKIIEEMKTVREIVTKGLELRQKAGIKIRQPLQSFCFETTGLEKYYEIIKEELNVKEILVGEFKLDTNITDELKQEGYYRELVRGMQDMRKNMGLTPSDAIALIIDTNDEGRNLIKKFEKDLLKAVLASKIEFIENEGAEIKIGELLFNIKIDKI